MKNKFYAFVIILAFVFFPVILIGQGNNTDVVYLKNGSIIRGMIIEQVPNQSIKIQTQDNNVFVYKIEEVEKITKEQASVSIVKKNEVSNKGFSLGLKAGINLSSWSNIDISDPSKKVSKLGFQGGFVGKIGFNKYLAVQMELLFAQKGLKVKATASGVTAKAWYTVNYFEIPLLIKFSIPAGPVMIFANVGPSLGIGLSAKFATDPDAGYNTTINFEEGGLQRFDFGLLFGAGAGLKVGKGELFLDLRYGLGISDVMDASSDAKNDPDYTKYSNRNFGIAVGYLFKLGR
ncbi:MAG: porin family protein [Bacteroidota bacterium]